MLHRINIICYHLSCICEEIISQLNAALVTDNFREIISECINKNKEYINLKGFYIYKPEIDWNDSFIIELIFNNYEDTIKIKFTNYPDKGMLYYKASIIDNIFVVSNPLHFSIDGIIYSSYQHKILYADQFTKEQYYWSNISGLSTGFLEIPNEKIDELKRIKLIAFLDKLSPLEKANLKIVDVDIHQINNFFDVDYEDLLKELEIKSITCLVLPDRETIKYVRKYINNILIISQNSDIPLLNKNEWINRSLTLIRNEYQFSNNRKELIKSIYIFKREYHLSKKEILDICTRLFSTIEFNAISKYL